MMWLVWRQQRAQVLSSVGVVAALILMWAFVLVEVSGCDSWRGCSAPFRAELASRYGYYCMTIPALCFVLGVFAGAPLFAREFEERTHAFVMTQTGGRGRWILLKIVISVLPVAIALTGLGVISAVAHERAWMPNPLLQPTGYMGNGVLLVGLFLLAFGLSVLLGVIGRKTLPAMVLALVGFLPATLIVAQLIRPGVLPPERVTMEITDIDLSDSDSFIPTPEVPASASVDDYGYLDVDGAETPSCVGSDCEVDVAMSYVEFYWNDEFWSLQWFDFGCYAALSLLLTAGTVKRMTRAGI